MRLREAARLRRTPAFATRHTVVISARAAERSQRLAGRIVRCAEDRSCLPRSVPELPRHIAKSLAGKRSRAPTFPRHYEATCGSWISLVLILMAHTPTPC